ALGVGTIHAVGLIGRDGEGFELREGLHARGVTTGFLTEAPDRFTPTYTKPMAVQADGSEVEMNRQDIKNRTRTPEALEDAVIGDLRRVVPEVDAVIALDQVQERNFGVVTDRVRAELATLAREHTDTVFFGDARAHIADFRNIIIKPNAFEAVSAIRPGYSGEPTLDLARDCAEELARRTARPLYVTLGPDGILVFDGKDWSHARTVPAEGPIDIVGAGDSTTAGIVSSLCSGASLHDAALIGNVVASITIQRIGTTGTASPEEVRARFGRFAAAGMV
ncbi:carbohydrate kinase, partial [Candidatus Poribacteria bacterium]|nr:carbohydrate kinase [Candidatus Poribacteria bacterium]